MYINILPIYDCHSIAAPATDLYGAKRRETTKLYHFSFVSMDKDATRKVFLNEFEPLREDLLDVIKLYSMPEEAIKWFSDSFSYNVPGGKLNRGLSVVDTYAILKGKKVNELESDELKKVTILGWCVEMLQAFFLVADDIMDKAEKRRGHPCWYKKDGVGLIAINDSFVLEGAIYVVLKKYFKKEPYYVELLELFHDITFKTELGQFLDLIVEAEHQKLDQFSMDKHDFVCIYKTAYYSFLLPVALAMYVAGIDSDEDMKQVHDVLIPLGLYFQNQDDFLDVYAPPEILGKIGRDILENKNSWLILEALKIASPEQKKILAESYGQQDAECEARVKKIYHDLAIDKVYEKYEEEQYQMLSQKIASIDESRGLKKDVLTVFLNKVYKRQK